MHCYIPCIALPSLKIVCETEHIIQQQTIQTFAFEMTTHDALFRNCAFLLRKFPAYKL